MMPDALAMAARPAGWMFGAIAFGLWALFGAAADGGSSVLPIVTGVAGAGGTLGLAIMWARFITRSQAQIIDGLRKELDATRKEMRERRDGS